MATERRHVAKGMTWASGVEGCLGGQWDGRISGGQWGGGHLGGQWGNVLGQVLEQVAQVEG